jgi:hypothetical protein
MEDEELDMSIFATSPTEEAEVEVKEEVDRKKFQAQSKAGEVLEIQDDISTFG